MKRIIIILTLIAGVVSLALAQNKQKVLKVSSSPSIHLQVFEQAKLFGDVSTVLSSLNYLIATEPVKYASYADTLAIIYQNTGNYVQCLNVANMLLMSNPEKESLLSLKAISHKQLGQNTEAVDVYNRLFVKTNKYNYAIELLQLQLQLQRLVECQITANKLLAMNLKADEKIVVPTVDGKSTQKVNINALVYYVQCLAFNLAKEKEKAIEAVNKAIALEKDFELAAHTLKLLTQAEATTKDTPKNKE